MNRLEAYRKVVERLDRIACGHVRPGHAEYCNKAAMARMASEALAAMDVLFPDGVVDGARVL